MHSLALHPPLPAVYECFTSSLHFVHPLSHANKPSPLLPAWFPVLVWRNDCDVDLLCRAEESAPLFLAEVHQDLTAETNNTSPQLQPTALCISKPLQLSYKAFLAHQEARLTYSVPQGCDLTRLTTSCYQLPGELA